jgi:primosomal protein N'
MSSILVPDYYAAGAWFARMLKETFAPRPVFSSGTPVKQRWRLVPGPPRGGHIVLGNKNCVFLPLHGLSLIIVGEMRR